MLQRPRRFWARLWLLIIVVTVLGTALTTIAGFFWNVPAVPALIVEYTLLALLLGYGIFYFFVLDRLHRPGHHTHSTDV